MHGTNFSVRIDAFLLRYISGHVEYFFNNVMALCL
jgi:hypothetical protein